MKLTEEDKIVRKELEDIYPQLLINAEKVCGAAFNKHGMDLLAVGIEQYLKKPIEYQLKVISDGKLEHFITHIMNFQLKHATTHFYHHYRKHHEKQRELFPNYDYGTNFQIDGWEENHKGDDDAMLCVKHHMKKLDPYRKMLVDEYVINGLKFNHISKKYNIGYHNLKKDLNKVLKEIKALCNYLR